jgi:starch synthase
MVASEAEPYAKTGGLGDVVGALPRALADLGHDVRVVLPLYRSTRVDADSIEFKSLTIPIGPATHFPTIRIKTDGGVSFYFIDYPPFFDRDGLYAAASGDYWDNPQRFMLLSRVGVELAKLVFIPHVLHCHDWQAAMAPVLLKSVYTSDPALRGIRTVFSIHNLAHDGNYDPGLLSNLGLAPWLFGLHGLEFYGRLSFLKGGLVFADRLTTVSQAYAREIQTPDYGCGFDGLLRSRAGDLRGILNGVDYERWNPAIDPYLVKRYGLDDLGGKEACKRDLLETLGLPSDIDRPVIGMVSRIVPQKGFDLLAAAADELLTMDLSLVVLGTGDPAFELFLRGLADRFPEKLRIRIAYDETLAHKIEAGSDMFLMPSRYEPSGLSQLYSFKYGTVPLVRATGGLDDSVEAFDPERGQGTGFKFSDYEAGALLEAVRQALRVYQDRGQWRALMLRGMRQDFSWRNSAGHYLELYREIVPAEGAGHP